MAVNLEFIRLDQNENTTNLSSSTERTMATECIQFRFQFNAINTNYSSTELSVTETETVPLKSAASHHLCLANCAAPILQQIVAINLNGKRNQNSVTYGKQTVSPGDPLMLLQSERLSSSSS